MDSAGTRYGVFRTEGGYGGIAWNETGITRLSLPASTAAETERTLRRRLPEAEPGEPSMEATAVIAAVKRYFEGLKTEFLSVRLDLGPQETLVAKIYAAARKIGWGQTTTYGALAENLGAGPETAREVGRAMARNPVPLIIPCHRVLAAGGKIGGFSAPGGSATKIHMLELEGVVIEPARPAQGSLGL